MMNRICQKIYLLVLMWLPLTVLAQSNTPVAGARINEHKCLGYELDYDEKKYSKTTIKQIQNEMKLLYQEQPEWKADFAKKGDPLADGLLGKITWKWMERFCNNFALDTTTNVASIFAERLTQVTNFSKKYPDEIVTLISNDFSMWWATEKNPCVLNVRQVLLQGTDDELRELVSCYLNPPEKSAAISAKTQTGKYNPNSIFALDDGDFLALTQTPQLAELIQQLGNQKFSGEEDARKAVEDAYKKLKVNATASETDALITSLQPVEVYVLDDKVMDSLYPSGIGDEVFSQLQALPVKMYDDEHSFNTAITNAIQKAQKIIHDQVQTDTDPEAAPRQLYADALLVKIRVASKTQKQVLTKDAIDKAFGANKLPFNIVRLLEPLRNVKYPEGELLHFAIKHKLIHGLCGKDASKNNHDHAIADRTREAFQQKFGTKFIIAKEENRDHCYDSYEKEIGTFYDENIRRLIEQRYVKDMPRYSGETIAWNGDNCGCVPEETATTGYGIFPYWNAKNAEDKENKFDFSTFSRVGYFGLTVNKSGKLVHLGLDDSAASMSSKSNADNFFKTDKDNDFIEVARRYGSKLDWIIYIDWSAKDIAKDEAFLLTLEQQLLDFISQELSGPEVYLRPLFSLGAANRPVIGDGISLYFKNYPEGDAAKENFNKFFKSIKPKLRVLDKARNDWRSFKDNTYLNIIVNQADFMSDQGVFSYNNIYSLFNTSNYNAQNESIIAMQDNERSLAVVLLQDPYYTSLAKIDKMTTHTSRNFIVPLMIKTYKDLPEINNKKKYVNEESASDPTKNIGLDPYLKSEGIKELTFIHESFGGGAFWPINEKDAEGYEGFTQYIELNFSPGYDETGWYARVCEFRWLLIGILNLWLVIAFTYFLVVFFIHPYRCRELPKAFSWLSDRITVLCVVIPPIGLWVYLLYYDPLFKKQNPTSLLVLVVIVMAIRAAVNSIRKLEQKNPNRIFLQQQEMSAKPAHKSQEYSESKAILPEVDKGNNEYDENEHQH